MSGSRSLVRPRTGAGRAVRSPHSLRVNQLRQPRNFSLRRSATARAMQGEIPKVGSEVGDRVARRLPPIDGIRAAEDGELSVDAKARANRLNLRVRLDIKAPRLTLYGCLIRPRPHRSTGRTRTGPPRRSDGISLDTSRSIVICRACVPPGFPGAHEELALARAGGLSRLRASRLRHELPLGVEDRHP